MKKIDLGQAIAILANLGVIAGIIFLALELHQNNEFLEQQQRYTFLQNVTDFTEFSVDADIARLLVRSDNAAPLSKVDSWRRCQIAFGLFFRWQWEFENLRIDGDTPATAGYRSGWQSMELDDCWAMHKGAMSPQFSDFIDSYVARLAVRLTASGRERTGGDARRLH